MTLAGQLRTELADGAVALSRAQILDDGARAAIALEPGVFRLDVEPREDTVRTHARALDGRDVVWDDRGSSGAPIALDAQSAAAPTDETPLRISLAFELRPRGGGSGAARVSAVLAVTALGDARFAVHGQVILRPLDPAP